jgi:hypothetical protein
MIIASNLVRSWCVADTRRNLYRLEPGDIDIITLTHAAICIIARPGVIDIIAVTRSAVMIITFEPGDIGIISRHALFMIIATIPTWVISLLLSP